MRMHKVIQVFLVVCCLVGCDSRHANNENTPSILFNNFAKRISLQNAGKLTFISYVGDLWIGSRCYPVVTAVFIEKKKYKNKLFIFLDGSIKREFLVLTDSPEDVIFASLVMVFGNRISGPNFYEGRPREHVITVFNEDLSVISVIRDKEGCYMLPTLEGRPANNESLHDKFLQALRASRAIGYDLGIGLGFMAYIGDIKIDNKIYHVLHIDTFYYPDRFATDFKIAIFDEDLNMIGIEGLPPCPNARPFFCSDNAIYLCEYLSIGELGTLLGKVTKLFSRKGN